MESAAWSTQQLSEFLEIFGALERSPMLQLAIDRVAESLDSEVVALVTAERVVLSRGFPTGAVPESELVALRAGRAVETELSGLGPVHVTTANVDTEAGMSLLVARLQRPFDLEEDTLVRSMGRALGLAVANGALVNQLAERHELAERLFRIEQSISHRAPLQDVLEAVTLGATELLGADIVGIHIVLDGPLGGHFNSMRGVGPGGRAAFAATPVTAGFAGRAFTQDELVVTDDYRGEYGRIDTDGSYGTRAAMAAPIHRNGVPVGVISVASRDPGRSFSTAEQEVLLTFAQHASLAVNDASAVGEMRQSLEGATYQARHDPLTGLLNRQAVVEVLDRTLAEASPDMPVAVLFVDVDRFKAINDVLGHAVGDAVLVEVSRRLASQVRSGDVVARLAGDEFLVVAGGIPASAAEELAERLNEAVSQPIALASRALTLTVSVGVAVASAPMSGDDLLADADVAMYRAKQRGRSQVVHFDHRMRIEMLRRSDLESDLHSAIRATDQLEVHYQPIYRIDTEGISGFEALIRWNHPERGLLAAGEFVTLAEETGQVAALDRLVLEQATQQLAAWRDLGARFADLSMAVNLSARQFADPNLVPLVDRSLEAAGLPPEALWLEITETIVMEETDATLATLAALRERHLRLSIDDFGTGYSSLAYLKRFPVDTLKIDRAFVSGLCADRDDEAIVTAVIRLAEALALATIAEGVEKPEQLEWLRRHDCDFAQGYLLARPVSAAVAQDLLLASSAPDHQRCRSGQQGRQSAVAEMPGIARPGV